MGISCVSVSVSVCACARTALPDSAGCRLSIADLGFGDLGDTGASGAAPSSGTASGGTPTGAEGVGISAGMGVGAEAVGCGCGCAWTCGGEEFDGAGCCFSIARIFGGSTVTDAKC